METDKSQITSTMRSLRFEVGCLKFEALQICKNLSIGKNLKHPTSNLEHPSPRARREKAIFHKLNQNLHDRQ
jgi:hypothetical protein